MRSAKTIRTLCLLACLATTPFCVGCRAPGSTFGSEPLQTRFAALAQAAVEAEPERTPADPYLPPTRLTAAEPVVLARQ